MNHNPEDVALFCSQVVHEAVRRFRAVHGNYAMTSWEMAGPVHRTQVGNLVAYVLEHGAFPAEAIGSTDAQAIAEVRLFVEVVDAAAKSLGLTVPPGKG